MPQHLFIDHAESRLKLAQRALEIRIPGRPLAHVPLHNLEQVSITADIEVPTRLIHALCSAGIPVSLLHPRQKVAATQCLNLVHGNHGRRLRQYQRVLDTQSSLAGARRLVAGKLLSQERALGRYGRERAELQGRARRAAGAIAALRAQVSAAEAETLLGLEGAASRAYFEFLRHLFAESWAFEGRNKRPPRDPVNALLSLSYSLLTNECARALQVAGLDPAYGVYHSVHYGRPSLACDLVELFRVCADAFVWRLLAEQRLRPHHFSRQLQACVLKKEGRQRFFPAYQVRLAATRRLIARSARALARELDEEIAHV